MTNQRRPTDRFFEVLQDIQDFADRLTVKRILLALCVGLLTALLAFSYENRHALFHKVYSSIIDVERPVEWQLGEETREHLAGILRNDPIIGMILVTEINLQKNKRTPKFFAMLGETGDPIRRQAEAVLPQPVFDQDPNNTKQIVGILNNEFVCNDIRDTTFYRSFPLMAAEIPVICRIAIPPFYGRFVGVLTFGFTSQPSREKLDAARLEMSRLAVEIYIRDINKSKLGRQWSK